MRTKNILKTKLTSLILCFAMVFAPLFPNAMPVQAAAKLNILEIGNSLTYSSKHGNSSIRRVKTLGEKGGYSFNIKYIAYGGEKLETYADFSTKRGKEAKNLINSQTWDIVVLQQETDSAILKKDSFKKAAKTLAAEIREKSPNARILLNCTWAYDKKMYGYSHSEQQKKMNSHYKSVAEAVKADVIYSGNAFDSYRKIKEALSLYKSDKNHASEAGCYLNACCLYTAFTGKTPYKVGYYGRWGKAKAQVMQKAARDANSHLIGVSLGQKTSVSGKGIQSNDPDAVNYNEGTSQSTVKH